MATSRRLTAAVAPLLLALLAGWAVVLGAATAAGVAAASVGASACTVPSIAVEPSAAPAGSTVTVSGQGFFEDCHDPAAPGVAPPRPDGDIRILFVQGGSGVELGRVDAGSQGSFRVAVRTPENASPGAAEVSAAGSNGRPAQAFQVSGHPPTSPPSPSVPPTGPPAAPAPTTAPRAPSPGRAPPTTRPGSRTTSTVAGAGTTTSLQIFQPPPIATSILPPPPPTTELRRDLALQETGDGGVNRAGVVLTLLLLPGAAAVGYLIYQRRFSAWPRRY